MASTFEDACQDTTNGRPWLSLLILAKSVFLAKPGKQGKTGGRSAAQRVKEPCIRWRAREEPLLWHETLGELSIQMRGCKRKTQPTPTLQENNAIRAQTLFKEGQLSQAARALVSLGLDVDSEEALQEMQARHPEAPPPRVPEDPPEIAPFTINSEEVEETIKSFRPGSAPSPSGLRGKHLKEVW